MDMHQYHLGFLDKAVKQSVKEGIELEAALETLLHEDTIDSFDSEETPLLDGITTRDIYGTKSHQKKPLTSINAVFSAILLFNIF